MTDPKPTEPEPLKRFYQSAGVGETGEGATVLLDGRPIRTPARAVLAVPHPVAERIAAEWNAQDDVIRPLTMPLTRLANSAIDGVSTAIEDVQGDIAEIAGNDLVFYRADWPAGLVAAQRARWDPLVRYGEERTGVRLVLAAGVMPVSQDPRFAEAIRASLPAEPLPLAALHQLTTLTGSALAALASADGTLSFEEAWAAAYVDEDWNVAEWGEDAEATARRAARSRDAEAAHFVLTVQRS